MLSESSAQAGSQSCGLVEMPFSQGGGRPLQCDRVQDCVTAQHQSSGTECDTSGRGDGGVEGGQGVTVNYQILSANLLTHQDFVHLDAKSCWWQEQ